MAAQYLASYYTNNPGISFLHKTWCVSVNQWSDCLGIVSGLSLARGIDENAHLWSNILCCKSSSTTCHDQIERICTIRPVPYGLLYREDVVRYDLGLADFPLAIPEIAEDIFENGYAFVSRGILSGSLRNDQNCCPELRSSGTHDKNVRG